MNDHWTAEEYREYCRTGKIPAKDHGVGIPKMAKGAKAKPEAVGFICEGLDQYEAGHPERGNVTRFEVYAPGRPQDVVEQSSEDIGDVNAWAARKCAEIARDGGGQKKRKYRNEPVTVDGIRFDSRHEAAVYQELMARVKAGELKCVMRQVPFDLGGGPNAQEGTRYKYIADFVTIDRDFRAEVIDAKSAITRKNRTYINKKKQMLSEWGIEIREV